MNAQQGGGLAAVRDYYRAKLAEHGPCARGVDWRNKASQELRFDKLLALPGRPPFTLNDVGCGYGALLGFLRRRAGRGARYRGYDLVAESVAAARKSFARDRGASFQVVAGIEEIPVADYSVASGIFNVKLDAPVKAWERRVLRALDALDRRSRRGFAFNVLTSYSDKERQRPDLYYADPKLYFDYCCRKFSRKVALLQDYPLYEFTVIVRKEPR